MRAFSLILLAAVFLAAGAVRGEKAGEPELSPEYLSQIVRELYRWHLDETAMLVMDGVPDLEFRYRSVYPELDEGDRSQFIELVIPRMKYLLLLKKSDYGVPELGVDIQNADFRINRVEKYDELSTPLENYRLVSLKKQTVVEYLFATRSQRDYPDNELIERMRTALSDQYAKDREVKITGPQTIYVAPISRVSNNLWVFWENARKIIRFSSDSDLNTKAFWEFEKLGVRMYDLEKDVVVSHAEAAGSNAFVTRDWAARVLFNCVVLGQRQSIIPRQE